MKLLRAAYAVALLGIFVTSAAEAEAEGEKVVFKCLMPDGTVIYSDKREVKAQCSVVTAPINVTPTTKVPAPTSKPETEVSGKQDPLRNKIAEQERALGEAKAALSEQEMIRLGGEKNYQKVMDRLKPYQDNVVEIENKLSELRGEQGKAK